MKKIIYSMFEATEAGMSTAEFYAQFKTAKPELNKSYLQKGYISSSVWTVVFIDGNVAFAKAIDSYSKRAKYDMFYCEGLMAGWRVNDGRHNYRLTEEVTP